MSSGDLETGESILTGVLMMPWPPSVNTYWRMVKGRILISATGRTYRMAVAEQVVEQSMPTFQKRKIKVTIEAFRPDNRRRDLDNLLKAALDSMASAGVFDDDSQIVDLRIFWAPDVGGYLMVDIEEVGSGRQEPA